GRLVDRVANVEGKTPREPVESEIDDWRRVERKDLAQNKAADDSDAERAAKFGTHAAAESERQAAEERGHGGHHDGTEAKQASFVNGIERRLPFHAFGFEGEVNHHDGVFLDDADKKNNADESDNAEFRAAQEQRENRSDSGRRQRRKNRNRVN